LQLGFEHISDLAGFDHILFLIALCAIYRLEQWRLLLILVTAFTVGHSITLALASLGALTISSELIEFLIPTTILLTALRNVVGPAATAERSAMGLNYAMALFFGLIHGMGFSNYFRALMMGDTAIVMPLLGFNLGIELGQLLVVAVIVGVAYLFLNVLGAKHREWNLFVSGAAAGMSLILMAEARFW
ncbi:MAG: HupE/UreJ family protein, partial [Pseudomonadota bacterium]